MYRLPQTNEFWIKHSFRNKPGSLWIDLKSAVIGDLHNFLLVKVLLKHFIRVVASTKSKLFASPKVSPQNAFASAGNFFSEILEPLP